MPLMLPAYGWKKIEIVFFFVWNIYNISEPGHEKKPTTIKRKRWMDDDGVWLINKAQEVSPQNLKYVQVSNHQNGGQIKVKVLRCWIALNPKRCKSSRCEWWPMVEWWPTCWKTMKGGVFLWEENLLVTRSLINCEVLSFLPFFRLIPSSSQLTNQTK